MKVHKKITLFLTVLLLASIVWVPTIGQASTEGSYGKSCSVDRGTDVIFVINDSEAMLNINIASNPTSNDTYISEAIQYIDALPEEDRVAVIGFNDRAVKHSELTANRFETRAALHSFSNNDDNTRGGNDLSTGLTAALGEFAKSNSSNDKMIIAMTTGNSINNEKSLELARQAYEQDVTIHVFGFGSGMDIDETNLTSIAQKTGGNYHHAIRSIDLRKDLGALKSTIVGFSGREVGSNWTLTDHVNEPNGLLIQENVQVDLNGYKLTVTGDIILQPCAQLRAENRGIITANNVEQKKGSSIALNNSQLNVSQTFTQNGLLRVNGDFGGASVAEVNVNRYNQQIRGVLDLNGQSLSVANHFEQEGSVELGGGTVRAKGNVTQKGFFNVQKGKLFIEGNLIINGDNLRDEAFTTNRSLNVGGGLVQVGSAESMALTRDKGNIRQTSGQLFINHGTVRIFGDYAIADGWLTMIKGSMDTTTANYGEGDGDYVHVYGDFSTSSQRNHAKRDYNYMMQPSNDQGHLTDGVLRVDGNFIQLGDIEFHGKASDRSNNYTKDYSRLNFSAAGRHKVLLTGKGMISAEGTGFTFQHLEVDGALQDYLQNGSVKWRNLIERKVSSNAKLHSLSINNIPVAGFNPNTTTYVNHVVPAGNFPTLMVEAKAEDRNSKVEMHNLAVIDGKAQVKVIVTAPNGNAITYTVYVTVGAGADGRVTSIVFQQKELLFMQQPNGNFGPQKATIDYRVNPTNATNQQVIWTSTDESVAIVRDGIVTPVGVGEATIIGRTVDGEFTDSAIVQVLLPYDLLEGIKTLADLVSDNNRYDMIMSMYDLNDIGIVVPGKYIQELTFNSSGYLISGNIEAHSDVSRLGVRVDGQELPVSNPSSGNRYTFSRAGLTVNSFIEVIAYNAAGDELERIATHYPVGFEPDTSIPFGYNSIQTLFDNPYLFDLILEYYSLDQLRFEAH
ncbi:VWA domain-containing protein [Sporosarcina sp. FSL K6-3457]|uniref:VWA domain-containing protein n=1 Tax=Sporosarcina sp. FSL K6-3457 TaxID=2978204 RepID=UPI0030FC32F7